MNCEQIVYTVAIILFVMILCNLSSSTDTQAYENERRYEYYNTPSCNSLKEPFRSSCNSLKEPFRMIPKDNVNECMSRCQTNKDVAELLRNGSNAGSCIMDCYNTIK